MKAEPKPVSPLTLFIPSSQASGGRLCPADLLTSQCSDAIRVCVLPLGLGKRASNTVKEKTFPYSQQPLWSSGSESFEMKHLGEKFQ